ncbi:nucleoside phosphatase family-domain-containing protein [Melanogaster broomeanus]|nr:nucleoside phosphatase family-domain-containing protein [Melanogaster broomeanus]
MPPPTSSDSWLASRHFGIVIDAGSSGSRLQIYSWKDPTTVLEEQGDAVRNTLPNVEKGVRYGEDWMTKVVPGLSSFADNPEDVAAYLEPLLQHARSQIPPSLESDTPLFLLATAGMRLLTPLPTGAYDDTGFLDMGGASTQIAFEPADEDTRGNDPSLVDVRLRLLGGEEIKHRVFVTTWLEYGTNQARERYVAEAIQSAESSQPLDGMDPHSIPDPCLPKDLVLPEIGAPSHEGSATHSTTSPYKLVGTGSFTQCLEKTSPLLNKDAPCPDAPCLFNGIHVPPINFSSSHFIGVSEYWYSSEHVFGLGGPYDFVQYERAASEFCARDWDGILGGDGEVMEDGQVVETGVWGERVEISRLEMQCFKAAWVAGVLHDGIGIPRIIDPGGNSSTEGEQVAQQAEKKGLGKPMFQSVDTVGGIAISWTLGKMVLEASKAVKPLSSHSRPLVDPVQDIPSNLRNPPIKPIRPSFLDLDAIEERLSQHLPPVLTRQSLGFSPVAFYSTLLDGRRWSHPRFTVAIPAVLAPTFPSPTFPPPHVISSPSRPRLSPLTTSRPQRPLLRHAHTSPSSSHHSLTDATRWEPLALLNTTPVIGARSRNSSQISLTTLVPRQASLSRAGSMLHTSNDGSFYE